MTLIKQATKWSVSKKNSTTFNIPSGQWDPRNYFFAAASEVIERAIVVEPINGWKTSHYRWWKAIIRGNNCTVGVEK